MKIQVLLFAQARQIVGSDSIEVTIPDAATVADLKNSLSDSVPELTAYRGPTLPWISNMPLMKTLFLMAQRLR